MNWRSIGDASLDEFAAALAGTAVEIGTTAGDLYRIATPNTILLLAQLKHESNNGSEGIATNGSHNPLGLRPRGGGDGFLSFSDWPSAIREWAHRITDPTYAYATTTTVEDYVHTYAPSSDGNDEQAYVATIVAYAAKYAASGPSTGDTPVTTYPSYAVAGLSTKIVLPVPLIQAILPATQTNQRPGIKRTLPGFWVQHETANTNAGADAAMHARYLANGADGSQVSWHFTVDDHQIYQHIPIDEVTWQAADGSGPGNMSGVSCELCVNSDGDKALIRRNGEALCGTICAALGLTVDQIKRHYDFNAADPNRHHCPDEMMNEGYWPQFVANAGVVIAANQPGASPTPKPTPPPTWAPKSPPKAESATVVRVGRKYTILHACTPRSAADPTAPATAADFKPGDVVTGAWLEVGKDGLYIVPAGGSRIPFAATLK